MSWVWVGVGAAVGATAGAISGSRTGGDDVWKQALGGAALGGAAGGAGYAAFGAEAAAPAVVAETAAPEVVATGGTGILAAPATATTTTAPAASGIMTVEAPNAAAGLQSLESGVVNPSVMTPGVEAPQGAFGTSFNTANTGNALVPPSGMVQPPAPPVKEYAMFGGDTAPPVKEYAMFGGDEATNVAANTPKTPTPPPTKSPLEKGFESAKSWLSEPKNAMLTGVLGLGALSMFNNNNEDNFGGSTVTPAGYPLSPNFKPSRYAPTRTYADGGLTDLDVGQRTMYARQATDPVVMLAKGGDTSRSVAMIDPNAGKVSTPDTPDWVRSRGIYRDDDEDTMYQDALTAAQTRMGKAASRSNVKLAAMQKPTPLGKLNLGPVAGQEEERKATGGIASLGGYAHGGNPRLLRGPGDGMSDDIPASIGGKQPARLADGEFVVPADVVSGLGNGSTEAGAKKLHEMMDRVRVARTGTKKQGKQIDADKYVGGKASGGIIGYATGKLVVNPETNEIGTWEGADEFGVGRTWVPYDQSSLPQTTPSSTASTTAQGYNPDYYNPQVYQNQLAEAQKALADAQKPVEFGQAVGKDFDTVNLEPGTQVKWGAGDNWMYQTVGPDGKIALTPETFGGDPAFGTVKTAYVTGPADPAAVQTAQEKLSGIESNLARLQNSSVKYDPYTIANRPSADEPQFYGNIYKPEYTDYSKPGYDLGAGAGRWSNIAGQGNVPNLQQDVAAATPKPQFNEEGYLLQKLGQIKAADPYSEFASYTPQQLKAYMASEAHQLTPWQHYEKYGAAEGLNPYLSNELSQYKASLYDASNSQQKFNEEGYLTQKLGQIRANDPNSQFADYTPQQLKAYMGEQGMQPWQHYEQYGRTEGLNPYISNQTSQALAQVAATQAPAQEPQEKKARKGGILAIKK